MERNSITSIDKIPEFSDYFFGGLTWNTNSHLSPKTNKQVGFKKVNNIDVGGGSGEIRCVFDDPDKPPSIQNNEADQRDTECIHFYLN